MHLKTKIYFISVWACTFLDWTYFSSVISGRSCINLTSRGTEESVILLFFRMRVDKVLQEATDSHNSSTQASVSDTISRLKKQDETGTIQSSGFSQSLIVLVATEGMCMRILLTPGAVVCSVYVSAPPKNVWLQHRPHRSLLPRDWRALTRQTPKSSPALQTPPCSAHICSFYTKTHSLLRFHIINEFSASLLQSLV